MANSILLNSIWTREKVSNIFFLVAERSSGKQRPPFDVDQVVADLARMSEQPDPQTIDRLLNVRFWVEIFMSKWVAGKASKNENLRRQIKETLSIATTIPDDASFYDADEEFHIRQMTIAGAEDAVELIKAVMETGTLRDLSNSLDASERLAVVSEHESIARAILSNCTADIDNSFLVHLLNSKNRLWRLLSEQGSDMEVLDMDWSDTDCLMSYVVDFLHEEFGDVGPDAIEDIQFMLAKGVTGKREAATIVASTIAQHLFPDKFVTIAFEPERLFRIIGPFDNWADAEGIRAKLNVDSVRYFAPHLDVAEQHWC